MEIILFEFFGGALLQLIDNAVFPLQYLNLLLLFGSLSLALYCSVNSIAFSIHMSIKSNMRPVDPDIVLVLMQ